MKTQLQKRKERERRIKRDRNLKGQIHHAIHVEPIPRLVFPQTPAQTAHIEGRIIRNLMQEIKTMWTPAAIMRLHPQNLPPLQDAWHFGWEKALELYVARKDIDNTPETRIVIGRHAAHAMRNFLSDFGRGIVAKVASRLSRMDGAHLGLELKGRDLEVSFKKMMRQATGGGTLYYSSKSPKVEIAGRIVPVIFSAHARRRMGERLEARNGNFIVTTTVEEFIEDHVDFPLVRLPDGTMGLELWVEGEMRKGCVEMIRQVVGKGYSLEEPHMLKLGYCTLDLKEGMAVITTVLSPGMNGTPEGRLFKSLGSEGDPKTFSQMTADSDYSLLRKFQEGGFEQVRKI